MTLQLIELLTGIAESGAAEAATTEITAEVATSKITTSEDSNKLLDFLKGSIDESLSVKQGQSEAVQNAMGKAEDVKSRILNQISDLTSGVTDLTTAEKESTRATQEEKIAKLDAAQDTRELYKKQLDSNTKMFEIAQQQAEASQEKAFNIQQRMNGLKKNAEGDWVKMSPVERAGSFIFHNAVEYDSVKLAKQNELTANYQNQAKEFAVNRATLINNLTKDAEFDPNYIQKQKDAVNAIALSEVKLTDLKGKKEVYDLLANAYNLEQQSVSDLINLGNLFDETEKPRLYMQMFGLLQQATQLKAALDSEDAQNQLRDAFTSTYKKYLTGIGEDPNSAQSQANARIFASFAADGDIKSLLTLSKDNPETVLDIANIKDTNLTVDSILELPASTIMSLQQNENPLIQTTVAAFKNNYSEEKVRGDKQFIKSVQDTLSQQKIDPSSEEYSMFLEASIKNEAKKRASDIIRDYQGNSIEFARELGKLENAKSSIAAYVSSRVHDPDAEFSAPIINNMQTFSAFFDANKDILADNPSRFVSTFIKNSKEGKIPKIELNKLSDPELLNVAKAIAETFYAVQSATDLILRQEDALYSPQESWILSEEDAKGVLNNLGGKNLTDPATWVYILRKEKASITTGTSLTFR